MTDRATPSRPAKRQHTETIDLAPNSGDSIAAPESGKTHTVPARTQTLPANFNGDLSTLPDFNSNAHTIPRTKAAQLPATLTNSLLAYAATRDPYINSILAYQYNLQKAHDRAPVINFSIYSQITFNLLTIEFPHWLGSKTLEIAFDVVSNVSEMVDDILDTVRKGGGYDCSYGTRKNAVETIADIMKSMVMASPMIRHQARNYVYEAREMEEKLLKMMDYFDGDELAQLDEEGWTDKVRGLRRMNEMVMLEGDYEENGEDGEKGEKEGEEDGEDDEEAE